MADVAKVRKDKKGYFIFLQWQGERHFISNYMGLVSFRDNEPLALKAKSAIDSEIDRGIFRPERWKKRASKLYTIQGYSQSWLENIKPELSTATHFDYCNSFRNHINPIIGTEFIEDINLDKLQNLMNQIQRVPKGKKNVIAALHRMLKYAYSSGHINQMPIFPEFRGKNSIVKPPIKWIEPLTQLQLIELIPMRHRPIHVFIMLTGCRPSEARAFRKKDVKNGYILFEVAFGRNDELKEVKGKKALPFPLTEQLKELFETMPYKTLDPFMFINPETNKPYSKNLNRHFNRARDRLGLPKSLQLNHFGRHSFAMQMLEHIDKGMVSHLLRHSDPRMIDHYGEYQIQPLKTALDKIQSIGNLQSICNFKAVNE